MSERNKPCPCGSGKKSKRCCDSIEARTKKAQELKEERIKAYQERIEQIKKERESCRAKDTENGPFRYSPNRMMPTMAYMAAAMGGWK